MFIERKPLLSRFLAKVRKTPTCWVWTGARHGHGYGHIRVRRQVEKAHRVAWILFRGPIPNDKHVLHTCDNMRCVRPKYLYIGTPLKNAADRLLRNPNSWATKFTERQIKLVRWACAQPNRPQLKDIAKQHNMSPTYVSYIASGKGRGEFYRTRQA